MIFELPAFYHGYQVMRFENVVSSSRVSTSAPHMWAQVAKQYRAMEHKHGHESVVEYLGLHHFPAAEDSLFDSGSVELHRNRRGWFHLKREGSLVLHEYVSKALKLGTELNMVEMLQAPAEQSNELNALLVITRLLRQVTRVRRSWLSERFHSVPPSVPSVEQGSEGLHTTVARLVQTKINKTVSSISHSTRSISRLFYYSLPTLPALPFTYPTLSYRSTVSTVSTATSTATSPLTTSSTTSSSTATVSPALPH